MSTFEQDTQTIWPLPKYHFRVEWNEHVLSFQEVSGLDAEPQPIQNERGDELQFSAIKMSGIQQFGNVILEKGIFLSENNFWDWFDQIKSNTQRRLPLTISLTDENGTVSMVWKLDSAWPTKISGADGGLEGEQVSIERIEVAHEGITIIS